MAHNRIERITRSKREKNTVPPNHSKCNRMLFLRHQSPSTSVSYEIRPEVVSLKIRRETGETEIVSLEIKD